MKLPNEVYDILKWVTMICIPALTTAYVGLSGVWGWPYAKKKEKTLALRGNLSYLYMSGQETQARHKQIFIPEYR